MAGSEPGKTAIDQMARMTNIDRRTCHRVVPLKVLCVGLSRTGTLSLRSALKELGYLDTYHYSSPSLENPRDAEMWVDALRAKYEGIGAPFTRREWDQLLGHCAAITDSPSVFFYQELLAAYPNAKVILTTRPIDKYYVSFMRTLQPFGERFSIPTWNPLTMLYRALVPQTAFTEMNYLIFKYGHGFDFPRTGKERYVRHNEEVRRVCAEQGREVLEFEVGRDGWKELCCFLGEEVPEGTFPRTNDSEAFVEYWRPVFKALDSVVVQRGLWVLAGVVAVGPVAWAGLKLVV